ncbi:MAG: DNA double-strand break repair nuclease NurA [Thermoproteota archaeon]
MPYFADLLLQELRSKREEVFTVLKTSGGFLEKYRELFSRRWLQLDGIEESLGSVYAVDSSNDEAALSGGGVILFTRSLALAPNGHEVRKLRLDAFYPKRVQMYEEYCRLIREYMEHEAALKAIEEGAKCVLIDGSLYGRMLHVLYELDIDSREGFMLEYVRKYGELLSEAESKDVMLAGVSKDSRSTLFKEEVLWREAVSHVSKQEAVDILGELWGELHTRPRKAMEKLRNMVKEGLVDDYVYRLFEEARSAIPDSKIISLLSLEPGFSTPLHLRVDRVYSGTILLILREDEETLLQKLRSSFQKSADKQEHEFENLAIEAIRNLKKYPSIVTFYTVLERGDDPIRVDIVLGDSTALQADGRFLSKVPDEVRRVLGFLGSLYAGVRGYNMLLLEADRRVKMTAETMKTYTEMLMREYGELLFHSRGERRVFYP